MTEIISVKFKNRGKRYYFAPGNLKIRMGDTVVVETSKGMEIADCISGNHMVEDEQVVQPLRPVVRIATQDDLRVAEINRSREREAYNICKQQIEEHGLDMKLVDVECSFEGGKTTFFFTSDGRVDFRDLVKDLAGIFRNRIELRQIGVRDEAKMQGGIGICGRPYCCSQFLDDFAPVSTKMAKTQSLSLNPAKISGSCGRLMCCLRYEQDAYEELVKTVPKQGAFVETKDGYGTAVQVNLLHQTVKVRLDGSGENELKVYNHNELAAVPGGRPKEGEPLPSVLHYVEPTEEPQEQEEPIDWTPRFKSDSAEQPAAEPAEGEAGKSRSRRRRRRSGHSGKPAGEKPAQQPAEGKKPAENGGTAKVKVKKTEAPAGEKAEKAPGEKENRSHRSGHRHGGGNGKGQPEGKKQSEAKKPQPEGGNKPKDNGKPKDTGKKQPENGGAKPAEGAPAKKSNRHRGHRGKSHSGNGGAAPKQQSPKPEN